MFLGLPFLTRGLLHARDFAFVSELTEADTAESEFTDHAVRTTAALAAVVLAAANFWVLACLTFKLVFAIDFSSITYGRACP
jgi:hypothetical protein